MTLEKSYIILTDLRFFAYHGVAAQETLVGNDYSVNLKIETSLAQAVESDRVEHTINYAHVFEAVKLEMNTPSQLLEHVAGRILRRLFDTFPTIDSIELRLGKRNPPMGADIRSAEVEIHAKR